jgi:hypothetical protein
MCSCSAYVGADTLKTPYSRPALIEHSPIKIPSDEVFRSKGEVPELIACQLGLMVLGMAIATKQVAFIGFGADSRKILVANMLGLKYLK